jgi:lipoyl synthase
VTEVTTTCRQESSAAAVATRSGSEGSGGSGTPAVTLQKAQPRVHTSPSRITVAAPDVLAHNVETVPRLYPVVRKGARYDRSLDLLRRAAAMRPSLLLKSGIMVGFGETEGEVVAVFRDLFAAGCRSLTVGQYLPPSNDHLPSAEYVAPETFEALAGAARGIGFPRVLSGPLVRSSYYRAG